MSPPRIADCSLPTAASRSSASGRHEPSTSNRTLAPILQSIKSSSRSCHEHATFAPLGYARNYAPVGGRLSNNSNTTSTDGGNVAPSYDAKAFQIVSDSENEPLKPILDRFAQERGVDLRVQFKGSMDIMLDLEQGKGLPFDAVWPANSLWISLGDTQKVVKSQESIMTSPVVFGVKESVAKRLGWIGKEIKMADILKAAQAGKFSFAMTSATQSNSGATGLPGLLHALAGSPHPQFETPRRPPAPGKGQGPDGRIDRSSGSSGWLKTLVVENYDKFQAMVNYEALIIEANKE